MNLLVLTNNPERASFRQRIGIYLDFLRVKDIDCVVERFPSGSLARRMLFKQAANFDGVFIHKKRLNSFDAFWLRRYSRCVIYDFDDAVMYSDKHPERPSRKRQKGFQRTVSLSDLVLAGNAYLAEHAEKYNPNVAILPTGLDTNAYKIDVPAPNDGKIRLVWIGSASTLQYLIEIKPVLEEVGSRFDNLVLRIVCEDFIELNNLGVEKRPWSSENEVHDLATSDIGLAPLPDNRFTRGKCGFKILQYAAAGLPSIASPVGVNAELIIDGVTGFIAADTRQWIDRIMELIENPSLRKKMGLEGQAHAEKYNVPVIGKQLTDLISKCLQGTAL